MALAKQEDVEARLGRDLSEAEEARLPALLDDADAAVVGYCKTDFETPLLDATIAAADDTVSSTEDHHVVTGDRVKFASLTGGAGLTAGAIYFAKAVPSATTLTVSATDAGAAVNVTTDATAAAFTRYPKAVVGVVAKMVARAFERASSSSGSFVDQQNAGPFGVRYSTATSSGDLWLTAVDKMALRPHRLGGGLTSVQTVGERYEISDG